MGDDKNQFAGIESAILSLASSLENANNYEAGILRIGSYKIQYGWAYVTGNGTSTTPAVTVTFPEAFGDLPMTFLSGIIGYKVGSNPTSAQDLTITAGVYTNQKVVSASTGQVSGISRDAATTLSTNDRFGFHWLAVGLA